jgi:hypothetical protein
MATNGGRFAIRWTVSTLPNVRTEGRIRRKSPAATANIPVFGRLTPETGFDRHCVAGLQSDSDWLSNWISVGSVFGETCNVITIPNQSSVAKAYEQFDDRGRMKPSTYYDGIVDVMEELVKFTLLTRGASSYLTDRYSERKEAAAKLAERMRLHEAL